MAAFTSAFMCAWHCVQRNTAWLSRFSFAQCPHLLHVWDVYAGLTRISRLWAAACVLYSSLLAMPPSAAARRLWFSPRFAA